MPDDAKPQTPIDLTLDFESFATTPTHPPGEPAKPIDLNWDESPPTVPAPVPVATTPPTAAPRAVSVESLPEAVPVVPVVVPRVVRPAPVVRQVAPTSRPPESRNGRPAARRNVQAVLVVLTLTLATAVATLVLLYALYVGFKAFGTPKPAPTTPATRRAV